jgi:hypothetical protein
MHPVTLACLLSLLVAPGLVLASEDWPPHPALAEARAQALIHPKSPVMNTAEPRQWGWAEGSGSAMPVPGTGTGPRFMGTAPDFAGAETTPAPAPGSPPTK